MRDIVPAITLRTLVTDERNRSPDEAMRQYEGLYTWKDQYSSEDAVITALPTYKNEDSYADDTVFT